jgi:DNA-binding PadR family transcriptional regulator
MSEKEMHGLDMINRIKEVTSGEWAPSPGSVYPILRDFELSGLVTKKQNGRSLLYSLTDDGRSALGSLSIELKQQLSFMDWIMNL